MRTYIVGFKGSKLFNVFRATNAQSVLDRNHNYVILAVYFIDLYDQLHRVFAPLGLGNGWYVGEFEEIAEEYKPFRLE